MNLHLDCTPAPHWSMEFPADFRSLKVVVRGSDDPQILREALVGVGHRAEDDDHLYVEPEALVRLAGRAASSPSWTLGYRSMLAYAGARGWSDATGALRAHVIWPS